MDFDPDGIAIMSTYKYGSIALRHENAELRVPRLEWLGIKSIDISLYSSVSPARTSMTQDSPEWETSDPASAEGVLRLTQRDRRMANKILMRFDVQREAEWLQELQVMLVLNIKVEIQILGSRPGGLESWLERRLLEALQS